MGWQIYRRKELVAQFTVLLLSIGRSSQGGQSPPGSYLSRAGRGLTYIYIWYVCLKNGGFLKIVPATPNLWPFVIFGNIYDCRTWSHLQVCDRHHKCLDFSKGIKRDERSVTKTDNRLLFAYFAIAVWYSIGQNRKLRSRCCLHFSFGFMFRRLRPLNLLYGGELKRLLAYVIVTIFW